jgi:RNA polymerase-binding transcription factor
MYNSAFFSDRQESKMPAKKTASKKRKKAGATRKKAASKKSVARKKPAGKKSKVTKKKTTAKKSAKKKTVSKKKPAAKKSSKKKVSKKKAASRKKAAPKKAASKKSASKKSASKKASAKKAKAKKTSKKKTASTKKVSRKKPAVKKSAASKKKVATPSKKKPAAAKKTAKKSASKIAKKVAPRRSGGDVLSGPIHGIQPYQATRGEDYMSAEQLEHFREILTAWKRELMNEVDRTLHHMQDEAANFPDPNDRATQESEFGLELRTRDRERKLLRKINSALARIDEGTYGYCEETGEEIGLKRLEARPVATLCLEAQERREMAERQFRDRDDRYR